jgi:hypothetical protein
VDAVNTAIAKETVHVFQPSTSPHFSPVGADIAQQIYFHRVFSDRAE